jgi:hypothetical protein
VGGTCGWPPSIFCSLILFSFSLFIILLFYYFILFTASLHQGRQREPSLAAVIVVPCCVHGVRVGVVSTARKTG